MAHFQGGAQAGLGELDHPAGAMIDDLNSLPRLCWSAGHMRLKL